MENQVIDVVKTHIKGAGLSTVSPFEPNTGRVKHLGKAAEKQRVERKRTVFTKHNFKQDLL